MHEVQADILRTLVLLPLHEKVDIPHIHLTLLHHEVTVADLHIRLRHAEEITVEVQTSHTDHTAVVDVVVHLQVDVAAEVDEKCQHSTRHNSSTKTLLKQ